MSNLQEIKGMDAVIFLVSHSKFSKFTIEKVKRILFNNYNELNEVTTGAVQQKKCINLCKRYA
ncbi:hypothetical protein [Clostridium sp. UBA7791]|uniref:hypothetical protein n=1 Tax=Clostridium sp. UBA7791 TaxID=1946379 RepID=UPI00321758E3